MIRERVSTLKVRAKLGDILTRVKMRHEEFIIERKGEPLAVLVPFERVENDERRRTEAAQRARSYLAALRKTPDVMTDDEAMELANEAKRWARRQGRKKAKKRTR